jgi:hypothetical protein
MKRLLLAAGLALLALAGTARAAETVRRFYGYAYDLDSGRYLYTEVHAQRFDQGRWLGGVIDFYAPDGSKLGRKTLDFSKDACAPQFQLEQGDGSYYALAAEAGGLELQRREVGAKALQHKRVGGPGLLCADAGLLYLLDQHLAELRAGTPLRFTMLLPANLDTFSFRMQKAGESVVEGHKVITVQLQPDSLLRLLVGPILITYSPEEQRLLELSGPSNIHDPVKHTAYRARVIYPEQPPAGAPAALPPLGN